MEYTDHSADDSVEPPRLRPPDPEPKIMQQLEKIREEYEAGRYDDVLADLRNFICSERDNILSEAARLQSTNTSQCTDREYLKVAAKFCIIRRGGINIARENRAQIEEILAEKWIRNQCNPCELSFNEVAIDWASKFGAGWRENRILTYIYLFERETETFLELLGE